MRFRLSVKILIMTIILLTEANASEFLGKAITCKPTTYDSSDMSTDEQFTVEFFTQSELNDGIQDSIAVLSFSDSRVTQGTLIGKLDLKPTGGFSFNSSTMRINAIQSPHGEYNLQFQVLNNSHWLELFNKPYECNFPQGSEGSHN
jgi:hypothetical protein